MRCQSLWLGAGVSSDDGLVIATYAKASYPDPDAVVVNYAITNGSKNAIILTPTCGGFEYLRLRLTGPDGKAVKPYPHPDRYKRRGPFIVQDYPPGAKVEDEVSLSTLFPFPEVGEYRCSLTRRLYKHNAPAVTDPHKLYSQDSYGKPVNVTAHEFSFILEKPTRPDYPRPVVDPHNNVVEPPGFEYDTLPSSKRYMVGEALPSQAPQNPGTGTATSVPALLGIGAAIIALAGSWLLLRKRAQQLL